MIPQIFWHGTELANIPGIVKKGLSLDNAGQNFGDYGQKAIYLTTDLTQANHFGSMSNRNARVILAIHASKVDGQKMRPDGNLWGSAAVEYYANIAPEDIQVKVRNELVTLAHYWETMKDSLQECE